MKGADYRADIDGLRALAVLPVLLFHAFPAKLPGGFVGVDVFFVISGYLITSIILKALDEGSFSTIEFYRRRVSRLFPALLTVLASCALAGWLMLMPDELERLGKHLAASAVFSSNFVFWQESGYFDHAAEGKPLLHLWSLAVEEQFYILWPLLLGLLWKRKCVITGAMLLIVVSLGWSHYLTGRDFDAAFYSPLSRLWELSAGGLLAACRMARSAEIGPRASHVLSLAGLLLLVLAFAMLDRSHGFPGLAALLPVGGAVLLLLAGPAAVVNRHLLSLRPLVWIGLISYPLYLWHWPLLSFLRVVAGDAPSAGLRLLALLAALLLAIATYQWVERPLRRARRWQAQALLLAGLAGIGVVGALAHVGHGLPNRPVLAQANLTAETSAQFVGPFWKYASNQTCLDEHRNPDAANYDWWFCMKNRSGPPTLLILGTSYANQLYPGFALNDEFAGHTVLSVGTCDFSGWRRVVTDPHAPCFGKRLTDQVAFIDSIIEASPQLRYVVIDGINRNPNAAYIEGALARLRVLTAHQLKVVVFVPHLIPNFHPKSCFSRPWLAAARSCDFDVAVRDHWVARFDPLMRAIRAEFPQVLIYDQNDMLCTGSRCSYLLDGLPLYRDHGHLSEHGSVENVRRFAAWVRTRDPEMSKRPGLP